MSSEAAETVWWTERPAGPTRMARILHKMRLRQIPHQQSVSRGIPVDEIDTLDDPKLQEALRKKIELSSDSCYALAVVANSDGTYAASIQVPRGPLSLSD